MPGTGNIFPGTGANDAGIGATAWTNPTNIQSDNATDASCNAAASSQYLVAKNFGFTVPATATIRGITVRIEAAESSTGSETLNIRLQNDSGALFGTGKTQAVNGTSPTVYTLGSATDLWGATITPAIVNDVDFGVRFWYTTSHNMTVDYVTVAVQYTLNNSLVVDPATYAFTTQDATVRVQRKMVVAQPSYSFTTETAAIRAARKLVVTEATYSFSPADATFRKGYGFGVQEAGYSFTPADVTLMVSRKLSVSPATYSMTAQDAGVKSQRRLSVMEANYSFSTQDASVITQRKLSVTEASYSFSTSDAVLKRGRKFVVDPATYSFSTEPAGVIAQRKLPVTNATYDFTAQDAGLDYGQGGTNFIVDPASYVFTESSVGLFKHSNLTAVNPTYLFTSQSATFSVRQKERLNISSGIDNGNLNSEISEGDNVTRIVTRKRVKSKIENAI